MNTVIIDPKFGTEIVIVNLLFMKMGKNVRNVYYPVSHVLH